MALLCGRFEGVDHDGPHEATLRFLLWHEYLHLYLMEKHTPEFRRLERMWPGYIECDREMDALNETFGVQYW